MAGDWIPIRCDLATEPEVIAIASATGLHEFAVVGRLHRLWSWANRHTTDGNARSVTFSWIDRYLQHDGFAQAMQTEKWLVISSDGVAIPHFDRFNSQSGKQRLLTAKRVSEHKRKGNADGNAKVTLDALPKEKNRREESSPSSPPPPASQGGDSPPLDSWQVVEGELLRCGVVAAHKAVVAANENGCTSDAVTDVIGFWRLNAGAWDAGALYSRIINLRPGQGCSELWPPKSAKFVRAKSMEASNSASAVVASERVAGEQQREKERRDREVRERRFGAKLDALARDQIVGIIEKNFEESAPLVVKRLPAKGPIKGAVRDELLIHLEVEAGR